MNYDDRELFVNMGLHPPPRSLPHKTMQINNATMFNVK